MLYGDAMPFTLTDGGQGECGVFAVYAPGEAVAKLCYYGLYALQHRGQESAGIAVSNGAHILVRKDMGLVSQVFSESQLADMGGHLGIGHVRYSTTGPSTRDNAQPVLRQTTTGRTLALAHNGNLTNAVELAQLLGPKNRKCATDSALLAELLAQEPTPRLDSAFANISARIHGAYSMVMIQGSTLYGVRDPHGIRPLVLGQLQNGWVLASETPALDIIGAQLVREIAPGELVAIDEHGLRSRQFADPNPSSCLFEYVYVARPDHRIDGHTMYSVRRHLGMLLAEEAPVEADLVIPVPDSGTPAAAGYSEASRIPYAEGLTKNRYVGRTFIQPTQTLRKLGIRLKLNPLCDVIDGKRLIVVDDSIVRGNTSRQLVTMLRQAGAVEVHLRITSPPIRHPCFYGIDMPSRSELLASDHDVNEIREFLGADSLAYLSLDALIGASGRSASQLCRACFDGRYPIPVSEARWAEGRGILATLGAGNDKAECNMGPAAYAEAPIGEAVKMDRLDTRNLAVPTIDAGSYTFEGDPSEKDRA
jgi:amidophosphoribosyltransferase